MHQTHLHAALFDQAPHQAYPVQFPHHLRRQLDVAAGHLQCLGHAAHDKHGIFQLRVAGARFLFRGDRFSQKLGYRIVHKARLLLRPALHLQGKPFVLGAETHTQQHGKDALIILKICQQSFLILLMAGQYGAIRPFPQYFVAFVCQQPQPGQRYQSGKPLPHQRQQFFRIRPGQRNLCQLTVFHGIDQHIDLLEFVHGGECGLTGGQLCQEDLPERLLLARDGISLHPSGDCFYVFIFILQQETLTRHQLHQRSSFSVNR